MPRNLETSLNDAISAKILAMEERLNKCLDDLAVSMSQIANQVSLLTDHFMQSDDGNKEEEKRKGEKKRGSSSRAQRPPPPNR